MNPTDPRSNRTRPAKPEQPRPDEPRIGPYRVVRELGRGGMGTVYRAKDPRLGREVAVKVLAPEVAGDPAARARFLREARALAAVEHDHIVPVHEVNEDRGTVYLVMPLLKGQPLGEALRQSPRPPVPELVRIGREIADGLAAAHAAGLVHRDIKPGNVWLEAPKRRVKILDFGIARAAPGAGGSRAGGSDPLTGRNEIIGTPYYMSPEQARGRAVDARSDLFSLGVVLYQMATGRRPFEGTSDLDVLAAVVSEHPPAAHEVEPGVPAELSDLIARMLAKDPDARPPGAEAVAAELDRIAGRLSGLPVVVLPVSDAPNPWADLGTTVAEPDTRAPVRTRRAAGAPREPHPRTRGAAPRWLWPAVAGGVLLAAVLTAVVAFGPNRKNPEGTAGKKNEEKAKGDERAKGDPPQKQKAGGGDKGKDQPRPDDPDAALAEAATPYAVLELVPERGAPVTIPVGGPLPPGPYRVRALTFPQNTPPPPPDFRAGVLLPRLRAAPHVERIGDRFSRLGRWTDAEWAALAGSASAKRLADLDLFAALTDETLAAAKLMPELAGVRFLASGADAARLAGLKDVPKLHTLALQSLGREARPTEGTWRALGALPVRELFLWDAPPLDAPAARALAGMPNLTKLGVSCPTLTDAVAAELLARPGLTSVALSDAPRLTDKVCDAILARPTLYYVQLANLPNVTGAGVARVRDKHPGAAVDWDGPKGAPPKPTDPPAPTATAGLAFDGTATRVTVPKLGFDGKLPLTVEAWVTPLSFGTPGTDRHLFLFGKQLGGAGFTQNDGFGAGVRARDGFDTAYLNVRLTAGRKVHVAAVFADDAVVLFVDGTERGRGPRRNGPALAVDAPAVVGGPTADSGGGHFHGTLHALRVSRVARYTKPFAPAALGTDADTVALYACDEGAGDRLTDRSGNGYDGTISNGKWAK